MDGSCWQILGIQPTKDKLAIKKAYAKLAHSISPEDDPEGFRRIHTAYKQAMDYASGRGMPIVIRIKNSGSTQDSSPKEEPSEKPEPKFDFTSVDENKKDPSSSAKAPVSAPEKKDPSFDFSPIDTGENGFSDEIELCLEKIVDYKEKNGVDTKENVNRWKGTTLLSYAKTLFFMYQDLYTKCDDIGVWHVFFKEPLVTKMMIDSYYRAFLLDKYNPETEVGQLIEQECDFYHRHVEETVRKSENVKVRSKEDDKKAVLSLIGVVVFAILAFSFAMFIFTEGVWAKRLAPGLLLVCGEAFVYCFFRFFSIASSEPNSPSYSQLFELPELAFFIAFIVLLHFLYWVIVTSAVTDTSTLNILFMVAGEILGSIAAVFMGIKIAKSEDERRHS